MKSEFPKTHLLNPSFDYKHSWNTNVKETIQRIREQQEKEKAKPQKVLRMKR
jgi:hypothetical protein